MGWMIKNGREFAERIGELYAERNKQIVERYREGGVSFEQLAGHWGLSKEQVRQIWLKEGVNGRDNAGNDT